MSDQTKCKKILEILLLLSGNISYSISNISERFDISDRTAYRYINTFKKSGFVMSKNESDYIQIDKNSSQLKIKKLLF